MNVDLKVKTSQMLCPLLRRLFRSRRSRRNGSLSLELGEAETSRRVVENAEVVNGGGRGPGPPAAAAFGRPRPPAHSCAIASLRPRGQLELGLGPGAAWGIPSHTGPPPCAAQKLSTRHASASAPDGPGRHSTSSNRCMVPYQRPFNISPLAGACVRARFMSSAPRGPARVPWSH